MNVYLPLKWVERLNVLSVLCDTIKNCTSDEFLFVGGDFNCTENPRVDRNYQEPHPASSQKMKQFSQTYELTNVWRNSWSHCKDNTLSMARLDRFYCFKHQFYIFFIKYVLLKSAYWHFNISLLHKKTFRDVLKYFWEMQV